VTAPSSGESANPRSLTRDWPIPSAGGRNVLIFDQLIKRPVRISPIVVKARRGNPCFASQERFFIAMTKDDFYSSSNEDRWQLIRDTTSAPSFVRHEPNLSSGGRTTDTNVDEFLDRTGSSPENLALRALLDKQARTNGR
jgi:hypothetical protein